MAPRSQAWEAAAPNLEFSSDQEERMKVAALPRAPPGGQAPKVSRFPLKKTEGGCDNPVALWTQGWSPAPVPSPSLSFPLRRSFNTVLGVIHIIQIIMYQLGRPVSLLEATHLCWAPPGVMREKRGVRSTFL